MAKQNAPQPPLIMGGQGRSDASAHDDACNACDIIICLAGLALAIIAGLALGRI